MKMKVKKSKTDKEVSELLSKSNRNKSEAPQPTHRETSTGRDYWSFSMLPSDHDQGFQSVSYHWSRLQNSAPFPKTKCWFIPVTLSYKDIVLCTVVIMNKKAMS